MLPRSDLIKREPNSADASLEQMYDGKGGNLPLNKRRCRDSRDVGSDFEVVGSDSPSGLNNPFVDEISGDSVTPMTTALSNELVLTIVFKNLSVSELLSCRLVNKQWKEAAKTVLKSTPASAFITVSGKSNFDELLHCILDCGKENFPFRGIKTIISSSDFGSKPERWSRLVLFRFCGDVFTHRRASIALFGSKSNKIDMSTILSGPLASIEELEIHRLEGIIVGSGQLETLRIIKFFSHSLGDVREESLKSLLSVCPNLRDIRGINNKLIAGVAGANKSHLVSYMIYCSCPDRDSRERPGSAPGRLSTLSIKCDRNHTREAQKVEFSAIKGFLEASSCTLKCLEIRSQVKGGSGSRNWPVLPNLKKLIIATPSIFPQQVSGIFPALRHVVLDAAVTDLNLQSYFWTDIVPTVEILELHCHVTDQAITLLASIFPNVNSVLVRWCRHDDSKKTPSKFSQKMWGIWGLKAFEKLTKLKIIDLPVALMSNEEFSLDSFITGFPQFVLAKMRAKPELLKTAYVQEMREGGSIKELQSLEELGISFSLDGLKSTAFQTEPFVSELMLQVGLNLLPSLRATTFYYDLTCKNAGVMEKLLSPVAGRTNFRYFTGVSTKEGKAHKSPDRQILQPGRTGPFPPRFHGGTGRADFPFPYPPNPPELPNRLRNVRYV